MEMPGRKYNPQGYRYGFNGKENDRSGEWGLGLVQDYGFRLYNPGLGRFLSVDPLTESYPWYTPYQFAGNMPIEAIDLDGLEPFKHAYRFANNPNPKLNLFHADNIINMHNSTSPTSWNSLGTARDVNYFFKQWQNTPLGKEALSKNNLGRIADDLSPLVDEKWNNAMRQFGNDGIIDEGLEHHHINKGSQAMPMPKSLHRLNGNYNDNHSMNKRVGPVNQTKNRVTNRVGRYAPKALFVLDLLSLVSNSPNSPIYLFHQLGTGYENRAYPTNGDLRGEENVAPYYEWHFEGKTRVVQYFMDYELDDKGAWRGKDPVGEKESFDEHGQKIKFD
jgi:RHS repeat-associated protein